MSTVIKNFKKRFDKENIKQGVQLSKLILQQLATDGSNFKITNYHLSAYNITAYKASELRDRLESAGFAVRKDTQGPDSWTMLPTNKTKMYVEQYKQDLHGTIADALDLGVDTRIEMEKMKRAIKYLIDKFDHPYTEEKYQQYTQETPNADT